MKHLNLFSIYSDHFRAQGTIHWDSGVCYLGSRRPGVRLGALKHNETLSSLKIVKEYNKETDRGISFSDVEFLIEYSCERSSF